MVRQLEEAQCRVESRMNHGEVRARTCTLSGAARAVSGTRARPPPSTRLHLPCPAQHLLALLCSQLNLKCH